MDRAPQPVPITFTGALQLSQIWWKDVSLGFAWWRHQMGTFSVLLAICAGNSPVTGEFPTQRPVTRRFNVVFDLLLNKRLSKLWWGWWAKNNPNHELVTSQVDNRSICYWPALRAGLLCCNFFGQPGSVSKFPPLLWVKLWVGWVGRGYTKISRYFPASWINWVILVTKMKLLYSLRF